VFVGSVGIALGSVDNAINMLRRTVEGIKFERLVAANSGVAPQLIAASELTSFTTPSIQISPRPFSDTADLIFPFVMHVFAELSPGWYWRSRSRQSAPLYNKIRLASYDCRGHG
jgi:hypothetical protein